MRHNRTRKKGILLLVLLVLIGCLGFFGYQYLERSICYPLRYEELIHTYAAEYDLPPALVAAIVRTESSFDPEAVSRVGAMGLMQIMPSTGEWIAGKLQDEPFEQSRLFQPETNIRYGCWFLRYLWDRYDGDLTLMLCGYNAGIGNVAKWLQNTEYSNDGVYLHRIPVKETENYVKKVTSAYEKYQALYDL